MKKWQRDIIESLYDVTNKIGGVGDLTAISSKRLIACTQANQQVASILAATFFQEDMNKSEKLLNELQLLSRWNFPDKHGNLSTEEKRLNDKLEEVALKEGLKYFFNR